MTIRCKELYSNKIEIKELKIAMMMMVMMITLMMKYDDDDNDDSVYDKMMIIIAFVITDKMISHNITTNTQTCMNFNKAVITIGSS